MEVKFKGPNQMQTFFNILYILAFGQGKYGEQNIAASP